MRHTRRKAWKAAPKPAGPARWRGGGVPLPCARCLLYFLYKTGRGKGSGSRPSIMQQQLKYKKTVLGLRQESSPGAQAQATLGTCWPRGTPAGSGWEGGILARRCQGPEKTLPKDHLSRCSVIGWKNFPAQSFP